MTRFAARRVSARRQIGDIRSVFRYLHYTGATSSSPLCLALGQGEPAVMRFHQTQFGEDRDAVLDGPAGRDPAATGPRRQRRSRLCRGIGRARGIVSFIRDVDPAEPSRSEKRQLELRRDRPVMFRSIARTKGALGAQGRRR